MANKLAVVVRGDLRMSVGKVAAQVAHAAVGAALAAAGTDALPAWLADGQPKVVLRVLSAEELEARVLRATTQGLRVTPVNDAGRTEVEAGTLTCCAFGPAPDAEVDRVTGDLPLY